jgi:hypothetical protein
MVKRFFLISMLVSLASCATQKANLVESEPGQCVQLGELYDWDAWVRDSIEVIRESAAKIGGNTVFIYDYGDGEEIAITPCCPIIRSSATKAKVYYCEGKP